MAQKIVGYREMMWTCPNCGAVNTGSTRVCKSCGSPMGEDVKFEQKSSGDVIRDEKVIEVAKRGADVYCAYCGNRNPAGTANCTRCGADLAEGTQRQHGQQYRVNRSEPKEGDAATPVACPACGAENPAGATRCKSCGSALGASTVQTVARHAPEGESETVNRSARGKGCGKGCLILIAFAILFYLLSSSLFSGGGFGGGAKYTAGPVNATVRELNWETNAKVMGYVESNKSDWYDRLPASAENVRCTERVRHTYDEEVAGSVEKCGEVYAVDLGNGFEELTQDCVYEVYDDYCNYTVTQWGQVGTKSNQGSGKNPASPVVSDEYELEDETVRFTVVLSGEDGNTYRVSPASLSEYRSYNVGDGCVLEINNRGRVTAMECQ